MIMLTKLQLSHRPASWLLALLIIISVLPAKAQEEPFLYELMEDGSGYIMKPRPDNSEFNDLFVPAEYNGLPIVGVEGFENKENILIVIFEEGSQVKYIGSFSGCTGLECVLGMPNTVETICDHAFYGCTMLRDISTEDINTEENSLSEGLKYIGISCFEGCTSLKSIKLPASLKVLRENAFRLCTGLETVEFAEDLDFYTDEGGYYSYGFYNNVFDGCESLHTVILPKNSSDGFIIPMATFSWCSNLKSIEFPADTKRIDQQAFYRSGIENLDLTTITSNEIFVEGYYTFAACENLKSVTTNGNFQFGRTSLYTFQDCKALKSVTINGSGDDYIEITPDAFRWCDNLETVEVYRLKGTGERNEMDSVFVGCKSLQKFTSICSPELNKIGYSCFDGCESLTEVSIPEQAFVVSETAFRGCAALQSLDLANVTSIGTLAFTGCSSLASISFKPSSVTLPTVETENAFDEWHFANTLIEVPDDKYSTFTTNAFWGKFSHYKHPSLFAYTEVTGGYSVGKSPYALNEDFIGMLEIPGQYNSSDVVSVAESTFRDLTGLTGVTLPESLTSIGNNAFAGCTNINTIINKGPLPLNGDDCPDNAFDNEVYSKGYLYVPFGSLDAYKSYAPWSYFEDRIKQGFGERIFDAPIPSRETCVFNNPFALALTNPNDVGTIYYYIVGEGDDASAVHTVKTYSTPITINSTCKVVAYVSDDTSCSEPVSFEYTYEAPEPEPSRVYDISTIPQGTVNVDFTTLSEYETLYNVVIGNVYYSITDNKSGYNQYGGLVFNKTSSIEDVAQFNRDVEGSQGVYSNFNGIAVKVKGTGSISFNSFFRYGNARLTLLLGDGTPVFGDELDGLKYEFSTPTDKYLYIFASPYESETPASMPSIEPAENSVVIPCLTIEITDTYAGTKNGLDKVLTANAGECYRINTNLFGHYFDGTYLYASTMGNSGSSKNTFNEDKKSEPGSDNDANFNQEDWVAISGLTSDFVGKEIESGNIATVVSNDEYPIISFPEGTVSTKDSSMSYNAFSVANFNIYADNDEVRNIWLVAPQPAEYCSITGYMSTEDINTEDNYFVLRSAQQVATPLTMKAYYDPATLQLGESGWRSFTGIVSKDGDALKFTALANIGIITGIEDVDAGNARVFASNGNINVVAEAPTSIIIYSANGLHVASLEASNATVAVTPGFYIVKVGNQVTKLAVK
ncbi:MAG: leucine-rich repeat protein [Muribaculaceae bacterium]